MNHPAASLPRADQLITGRPLMGAPSTRTYAWCLAHRQRVRWLPSPMWWHHTADLRTCMPMHGTYAPRTLAPSAGASGTASGRHAPRSFLPARGEGQE